MLVRVKMLIYFKTCEDNKLMINYNSYKFYIQCNQFISGITFINNYNLT